METIEIGAVMMLMKSLTIVDEFQTSIEAQHHPVLTDFCRQLTFITQAQINTAPTFPDTIDLLQPWLKQFEFTIFGSWGD